MAEDKMLEKILKECRTVAVVGASTDPERPSHHVASYLISQGFDVIPVNPTEDQTLSRKSYPDLSSIPQKVDVVDVFRRPEEVVPIAEEAVKIRAKVLWMQEGIINEEAASIARGAGLYVIMNKCIGKEHARLALAHAI